MEDTRSTPTADSMTADAEQITQAQDADKRPRAAQEPPTPDMDVNTNGRQDTPQAAEDRPRKRRKDNTNREAHDRYILKAYDRLELKLIAGDKSRLQAAAAALDISPTALIIRAVNAYTDAETLTEKAKNPYI